VVEENFTTLAPTVAATMAAGNRVIESYSSTVPAVASVAGVILLIWWSPATIYVVGIDVSRRENFLIFKET